MANEFTKPVKIYPAIVGNIADPDVYNQNIAGQSKGTLIPIDEDGNYADGDIGDETAGSIGALINNLKLREGGFIKIYDAAGVFVKNVNFEQASEILAGTAELATVAEAEAGTDDLKIVTPLKLAGRNVQTVSLVTGAVASSATNIPDDDTPPLVGEGFLVMTHAITPKKIGNIHKIDVIVYFSATGTSNVGGALFVNGASQNIASGRQGNSNDTRGLNMKFTGYFTVASLSSISYTVRIGGDIGGTVTFNGASGARKHGGTMASSITITEIQV